MSQPQYSYLIEPRSPLVFRSARPFGAGGGGDTLSFPLPSTVAGALRTAWAEQQGGFDYHVRGTELLDMAVHGPLLGRRGADGGVAALFPRPADALYLNDEGHTQAYRLAPEPLPAASGCDLPADLLPVALDPGAPKGKPAKDAPAFWSLETMARWLAGVAPAGEPSTHGASALPQDVRTHVALDPETFGSDPGRLFQSAGLDFGPVRRKPDEGGWTEHEYLLLARAGFALHPTLRRVGGEGRPARLVERTGAWPAPPARLAEAIAKAGGLRLVLATPAVFAGGWKPGWLDENLRGEPLCAPGLRLRLRACALERWQPLSGWDLARHQSRAVRRLVPAGSVYWFALEGGAEPAAIERLWLAPLADHEQDRRDGFGLALPGVWHPIP